MSEPNGADRIRARRLQAGGTAAVTAMLIVALTGGYLWLGSERSERPAVGSGSGDLMSLVSGLVRSMPRPGSGRYESPTAAWESAMATAARMVAHGRDEEAVSAVAPFGYVVERFTDTATGRRPVLLRPAGASAASRGWGSSSSPPAPPPV